MSRAQLFVYGSLKRGGRHHDLMSRARFLGEACTEPGFALEPLGDYLALVERPDAAAVTLPVPGELFEVDAALLAALDEFEGEGYERRLVPVREMSGEIRLALAYAAKPR